MPARNNGSRTMCWLAAGILASLTGCGGAGSGGGTTQQSRNFYGSQVNADDLANVVVGWDKATDTCNRAISQRWRSTYAGRLVAVRPFFQFTGVNSGYAIGNGGTIQVQLEVDDGTGNHLPSGVALATLVYDHPVTAGNHWPLLTFSSPPSLEAGQIYHLVFTNVAADPSANWVSLDHLLMWDANAPNQPTLPDSDLAVLERGCNGAWGVYNRGGGHSLTPILELDFEDGSSQGQGYIQGYGQTVTAGWVNPKPISGTKGVREIFTVSGGDRTVSAAAVRVNRTSGASPLTLRVEKVDGTLLGQGSVAVPAGLVNASHNGESWVKVTLPAPVTLATGQGYRLVLSSPADTVHTTHVLEKGISSGYKSTTYFKDGHAEFNDGTGWKGWDLWGQPNYTGTDLQFYFE